MFARILSVGSLALLGLVSAAACGSAEVGEEADEAAQDQQPFVDTTGDVAEAEQPINDAGQCCWIACKNDGYGKYYGPFKQVESGGCNSWGTYWCNQRGWDLTDAKWATCSL